MRKLVQLMAAVLVAAPGVAQAAEPPCLTAREFTDLSSYALPSIITGTAQRCSAALGPSAFLKRSGGALASRYSAAKPAAWPCIAGSGCRGLPALGRRPGRSSFRALLRFAGKLPRTADREP